MAIISLSDYKGWSGISVTTWDTQLTFIISAAQALGEGYCNRQFDYATYTEYYDGDNSGFILLRNAPISSITSIQYVNADGSLATAISSNAYKFNVNTGELFLMPRNVSKVTKHDYLSVPSSRWVYGSEFVGGLQNWKIVYAGGYGGGNFTTIPADLKLAMYQTVDELFAPVKAGGINDTTLLSETIGDYSYTRRGGTEISAAFKSRWGSFRRALL